MSAVIISYPPSGGGNHLKNILSLDRVAFENSYELNLDNYTSGEREVHSTPGRNMQEYKIDQAKNATKPYILHGHFGELAPWRSQINSLENKKWILITIDSERDQRLLSYRQQRLGQYGHDYYLYEEQCYLYQSELYQTYFTSKPENIYTIALNDFWHPNLRQYEIVARLNNFLNINVNNDEAQVLHNHWHTNNNIDFY